MRAIALERNELESLLFDMGSAPNKKHGELIDKCVLYMLCGVDSLSVWSLGGVSYTLVCVLTYVGTLLCLRAVVLYVGMLLSVSCMGLL